MRHHHVFSLGEFCYAVDLNSFVSNHQGHATINALWVEEYEEELTVCKGQLFAHNADSFDNFKVNINNRYGGHLMYRWDGFQMWGASQEFVKLMEAHSELEPALNLLPKVPQNYTGWFAIK